VQAYNTRLEQQLKAARKAVNAKKHTKAYKRAREIADAPPPVLVLPPEPVPPPSDISSFLEQCKEKWTVAKRHIETVEREFYQQMQSPPGIAQHSRRPLTTPSEMTCHMWVNFSRVYGKYLLKQVLSNDDAARTACAIIDFTNHCLAGLCKQCKHMCSLHNIGAIAHCCVFCAFCTDVMSAERAESLAQESKLVAQQVVAHVSPTEHSFVLHVLLEHMPRTLGLWGPARGFWCFPFERSVCANSTCCANGTDLVHTYSLLLFSSAPFLP